MDRGSRIFLLNLSCPGSSVVADADKEGRHDGPYRLWLREISGSLSMSHFVPAFELRLAIVEQFLER